MSIILDLIIVAIVVIFAIISAKKGFVCTLIEVVGFVLAIYVALTASTPIANIVYDKTIQPIVVKTFESAISDGIANSNTAVDAVWDQIPSFISENSFLNLSKENAVSVLGDNISLDTATITTKLSDSIIKPTVTKILSSLLAVIIVVILLLVVKIIAKYINKIFNISVIGTLNKTLGGILGIVKGGAIAVVFCLIISLILTFVKDGFLIFTYDTINASHIFKLLMSFSPFL